MRSVSITPANSEPEMSSSCGRRAEVFGEDRDKLMPDLAVGTSSNSVGDVV